MKSNNRQEYGKAIALTLILPFAGLIYSLSHWRKDWAKNIFWLSCIYLGAVFIYWPEGTALGYGADAGRHVLRLMDMYHNTSVSLGSILSSYMKDQQALDLYQLLVIYLVSRFTDNGHVLFAVFAFVFGFFYSRNIWYILEKLPNQKFGNLYILVALFFLVCPITFINGARMWTALHVYVYGIMPYLLEKDRSKLWWVALTPLIHYSFVYVAILGLLWFMIPYRTKTSTIFIYVSLLFFVSTLFVNSLDLNMVNEAVDEYSSDIMEERLSGYINEDYIKSVQEHNAAKNWYVGASGFVANWFYNIVILLLLPQLKRWFKNNNGVMHLFVFTLLIAGLANIVASLSSGGRFQTLSQMFKVPLILMVAMSIPASSGFRKRLNMALLILILPLVFNIRQLLDFFSITAFFGNFITVFVWENNYPIMDIIKFLI